MLLYMMSAAEEEAVDEMILYVCGACQLVRYCSLKCQRVRPGTNVRVKIVLLNCMTSWKSPQREANEDAEEGSGGEF